MAIFEAEHQHKTASEDQLTSRIFGALSIMDKHKVLIPFLSKLLEESKNNQLKHLSTHLNTLPAIEQDIPKVILWEHFGYRCPDVYIYLPKCLIVIEVKEHTKATSDQIVEQYNSVKDDENEVAYFLLTNDEKDSQAIADAKTRLKDYGKKIEWVQWKQVWKWLNRILKDKGIATTTDGRLLQDLIQLLEDKEMMYFSGIEHKWFTKEVTTSIATINELYKQLRLMTSDLKMELANLELEELKGDFVSFEKPNPKKPSEPQVLVPPSIEIKYIDKKWKREPSLKDKDAYISIFADLSEPSFSVGFCLDSISISDKDWDEMEKAARKKQLDPSRDPANKGKWYVGIWHYLIGESSINEESKEVTFSILKDSLMKIRDFTREYYGIEQTSRTSTRSKRRK